MFEMKMDVPSVEVMTTNNRGFTPEEIAQECMKKVIYISDNTDPNIRDQARAFSNQIEKVIVQYMKEAINSDRTTVYNAIMDAGHPELAKLIRRL
jgi:hypothetical protein